MSPRDQLIVDNRKLVFLFASKRKTPGVSLDDLVGAGNLGLVKAADRFDPARGVKFCSYAGWWIEAEISRYILDLADVIRSPQHAKGKMWRMQLEADGLASRLGREPSERDWAEHFGVSLKLMALVRRSAIACACRGAGGPGILRGDERDGEIRLNPIDTVADDVDEEPVTDDLETLARAVEFLPWRERRVLVMRFGLDGCVPLTLQETADRVGRTKQRIQQLQSAAIGRLREWLNTPVS